MHSVNVLAFDLGASSGRLILGRFDGSIIELSELHRFPNEPVRINGGFYWDTFRLFHEMKEGLKKAASLNIDIESMAIDTWGVDYGLIDKDGNVIGYPYNYRDERTAGAIDEIASIVPLKEIYNRTGIQFMDFNTLFQFHADKKVRPTILANSSYFMMMPDLFNYFLTGQIFNEYTGASTTQMINAEKRSWDLELIKKAGLRTDLFAEMVLPGTVIGELKEEIEEETGLCGTKVIAAASHDTASAVAGTPFDDEKVFLSSGTWSLLGMEIDEPIITDESYEYNYTNEGGAGNKIRFQKNINGLWIMQQLRGSWNRTNEPVSFPDIIEAAKNVNNKSFIIDPSHKSFMAPLNMIDAIREYCAGNGQGTPETLGELAIAVYNGLTNEYKETVIGLEKLTGNNITTINMIGGGIQDEFLCEMTAQVTGKKIIAGPVEASVLGNIITQLMGLKAVKSLEEGRKCIKRSFPQKVYG